MSRFFRFPFALYLLASILMFSCQPLKSVESTSTQTPNRITPPVSEVLFTATARVSQTPFQPLPTTAVPKVTASVTAIIPTNTTVLEQAPEISLLFTGVIVPARCVQEAVAERGEADYIYDAVRTIITEADLAVGVLNAAISDYPPSTGCRSTFVLVGESQNADALARAGFDMMNVATNHIKNCGIGDCGDRAFFDTLENLERVGIVHVGAGNNLEQALEPVVVEIKGVRFGFAALGLVEPLAFAGPDQPGIAVLNEQNLRTTIEETRQISNVVIVMPHVGPEDSPYPQEYQQEFARLAVEAGADLVIGNHTHVVQGIQKIAGVQVFYGLGNFVFDQDWDLAHQQGVMVRVKFRGANYAGFEFIPTHVDGDGTVHLAQDAEAAEILLRIEEASLPDR